VRSEGNSRRNAILITVAIACVCYAAYAIHKASRRPTGSNSNEVHLVCTRCWEEFSMTVEECEAATDEETDLTLCPKCNEYAGSVISLHCPSCKRAIPRSMVIFGTEYVCPFCKAPLASGNSAAPAHP